MQLIIKIHWVHACSHHIHDLETCYRQEDQIKEISLRDQEKIGEHLMVNV